MIKYLPNIYLDESVYSYLCRLYVHSGFVWHRGFANNIFARWNENPEYNFINPLSKEFRNTLERFIPYEKLLLEHTLFTYYARFLPKERRTRAYEYALTNEAFIHKYLPIPNNKKNYYLRFCPKCIEADRRQYGECYFHIQHLIPSIHICPLHNCELVDTVIPNTKERCTILMPLEQIIAENGIGETIEYGVGNVNIRVTKYINEIIHQPFNLDSNVQIGDYLTIKLKDKYLSTRGEQRYLVELNRDMAEYYKDLNVYDVTKLRLAYIFRNNSFNVYDILLTAMFEDITPQELCSYEGYIEPKHITFDRKVRELSQQGKNSYEIGEIMHVCHEVIRQVLMGTYDKPKTKCSPYRWQKWDWQTIDSNCCNEFQSRVEKFIASYPNTIISRRIVAEWFDLRDKSLRNLPRLQEMIREYKDNL